MRRLLLLLTVVLGLAASLAASDESYEIGSGDTVKVVVLDQAGLSGEFKVDAEGMVSFPFLGRVKASGMSPPELERKLVTLLSQGYLRKPLVSVAVKEFGSQTVFVTGEIQKPGPYSLKADRSLLALLMSVGDVGPEAGHEVAVIRPPGAIPGTSDPLVEPIDPPVEATARPPLPGEVPGAEVFRINLRELRAGYPDKNILLQAGDTVFLPKASHVYVLGQIARPGPYRFEEGLTVYQALLMAGGVTDRGSAKGVKIVRLSGGKTKDVKARMDDVLLPEDTIRVPERFF